MRISLLPAGTRLPRDHPAFLCPCPNALHVILTFSPYRQESLSPERRHLPKVSQEVGQRAEFRTLGSGPQSRTTCRLPQEPPISREKCLCTAVLVTLSPSVLQAPRLHLFHSQTITLRPTTGAVPQGLATIPFHLFLPSEAFCYPPPPAPLPSCTWKQDVRIEGSSSNTLELWEHGQVTSPL